MRDLGHHHHIETESEQAKLTEESLANTELSTKQALTDFEFHKHRAERDEGLKVAIAEEKDLEDILTIQSNSGAATEIQLCEEVVDSLVKNQQVLLATQIRDGLRSASGAIFFHCSDSPTSYSTITDPVFHDLGTSKMYDFWIIVDHNQRRSPDGTSVAKTLIEGSKELSITIRKPYLAAYSRAGDAYTQGLALKMPPLDFFTRAERDPDFKMASLLNYVLTTRERFDSQQLIDELGSSEYDHQKIDKLKVKYIANHTARKYPRTGADIDYFMKWIESKYEGAIDQKILSAIQSPSTNGYNGFGTEVKSAIPALGLMLRRFVNETGFTPIDFTLGAFHTGLGAYMIDIHLNSRGIDSKALNSNVEMSYVALDDLLQAIQNEITRYHALR